MSKLLSYTDLKNLVQTMIKPTRYEHSLRVSAVCVELAKRFMPSEEVAAAYVGLFHDAYRYLTDAEMLAICKASDLDITEAESKKPMLLHGAIAAIKFPTVVGPCPKTWKLAMRHHTLGSTEMGPLGAILYIADYIEPGREFLTEEDRANILKPHTLEGCTLNILNRELSYSKKIDREVAVETEALYHYLCGGGKLG